MFNSNILDIALGVIFVFLCVSLICTALNELIAGAIGARSSELERGIRNLVDGTSRFPRTLLLRIWDRIRQNPKVPTNSWGTQILEHPLINGLSKDGQQPSYVPSQTFVTALLDLVAKDAGLGRTVGDEMPTRPLSGLASFDQIRATIEKIQNPTVRDALLPLVEEARMDLTPGLSAARKFQSRVEIWYDHAMDRVSGWYKRRTQFALFFIAAAVAIAANIDTIAIFSALSTDSTLRASVVAAATRYANSQPGAEPETSKSSTTPTPENASGDASSTNDLGQSMQTMQQSVQRLTSLGIPMGWTSSANAHDSPRRRALSSEIEREEARADTYQNLAEQSRDDDTRAQLKAIHDEAAAKVTESQTQLSQLDSSPTNSPARADVVSDLPKLSAAAFFSKVIGLLLTAIAASLGAPFWFDLLNRVMAIRSAGKAPEENPKSPKAVLQPETPKENN